MEGMASGLDGPCVYLHPFSPAAGKDWMEGIVSFTKLKLSNKENGNGKVCMLVLRRRGWESPQCAYSILLYYSLIPRLVMCRV